MREFIQRRAAFKDALSLDGSLTPARYFRLMGLASAVILTTIPLSLYALYCHTAVYPLHAWAWDISHWNFGHVDKILSATWHEDHRTATLVELNRWVYVLGAIIFFGIFGVSEEARKLYRPTIVSIMRVFGQSLTGRRSRSTSSTRLVSVDGHKVLVTTTLHRGKDGSTPSLASGTSVSDYAEAKEGEPETNTTSIYVDADMSFIDMGPPGIQVTPPSQEG